MPFAFTPGLCPSLGCGYVLNDWDSAKRHWPRKHNRAHPYITHQGQRAPRPLLEAWQRLPSTLPTFKKGIKTLDLAYDKHLQQQAFPFLSKDILNSFNTAPWWPQVKSDLNHKDNSDTALISSATSIPLDHGSALEVDRSLFYSTQADLPADVASTLSAALDIRPSSTFGIKDCEYSIDANTASYGHPASGGKPDISMAITPAGHITEVHQDGVMDSSILIQLLGEKIIFMWPPIASNLFFASKYHRGDASWLFEAIKHFEQGKMVHLTPGCKIHLPLGTFHAVLALTPSCLAGYRVHQPLDLISIPRLLKWDIETSIALHHDQDLLNEVLNEHENLLKLWLADRASSVQASKQDLLTIKTLWQQDLRPQLNSRIIELSRPAKRLRQH
ncbi:unnamed protein product [Tilletia controversa]|nr:hypothetical protein CF336_g7027 [Tilletia laevis]CAD6967731.1 unnamed protein product [Tilletia controversa]CAD6973781.1 unnamed protein product [Tilletia controversa]